MLRIADDYDRLAQHPPTPESEAIVVKRTGGP
jgi:hypothetical protein